MSLNSAQRLRNVPVDESEALERLIVALERIADALEELLPEPVEG